MQRITSKNYTEYETILHLRQLCGLAYCEMASYLTQFHLNLILNIFLSIDNSITKCKVRASWHFKNNS